MPTDSFTWWVINLAITVGFIAAAIVSHNWLLAFGGLISTGILMMSGLAGASTEPGSSDELPPLVLPPESARQGPLHSEEELGGGKPPEGDKSK